MPSLIRPPKRDTQSYLQYLFTRTEQRLVNEITRKLNSGYVDYAERAALARVQQTLRTLEDECFKYVPKMVQERFVKTNKDLYGYSNAEALSAMSAGQNRAIKRLTENLLGQIDEAAAQTYESTHELLMMGRLENDPFRTAGITSAAQAEALGNGSLSEVTNMVTELETKGITAFVDKAGRHWSLRDYGNMAIRTTQRQAEVASVLTADEHDLWQIVKIGSTCPLCAAYEGRVYSKSGKNPNYPPLAMAFGKIDPAGGNDLSNTYLNIHPNCLHTLIKFTEMGKSDKQLQQIREFSSPITNPTDIDPRTKKQKEAYNTKTENRARLLAKMRGKEARAVQREIKEPPKPVRPVAEQEVLKKFNYIGAGTLTPQERLAAVNPHYFEGTKWQINCQRTVVAEELQARGYDVTAKPRANDAIGNSGVACWKFSGRNWYSDPDVSHALYKSDLPGLIEKRMSDWGDGSRAVIRLRWKNSENAHFITARRENGVIIFSDPQDNNYNLDFTALMKRVSKSKYANWIMRVDNRELTDLVDLAVENIVR